MKTKVKRMSKRTLAVFLGVLMLVSSIGMGSILTANAALSVAGHIYFIKPSTWTYASLMIGHSSYSCGYNMTNVSGTNLYYVNQSSAWSDSTEFAFFDVNGWGGEGNSISSRATHAAHSSTVNSSYAMNSGSTYLIATTANSPTYYSSGYSGLNNTLTIKTALKSGSTYSESSTKLGTFSASNAKKMNGNGSTTSSSVSQTNGTGTLSVARTNTATISQSAVSGYTFKGWKTGSLDSTGSGLSTGNYSFTNSGSNTTLYAYYEPSTTTYTGITAVAKGSSDGSTYSTSLATLQSSTSVNSATGLAVSATAQSGYTFYKWVSSGSGTFANANSASTTFYPAANSEIATAQYKKNFTISNGTTDTHGSVSIPNTSRVAGQSFTATITPSAGYRISSLTVGGSTVSAAAGQSSAYTYTGTASGSNATISVVATFEAIPGTTIYIKKTMPTFSYIHLWNGANTTNISDAGAWPGDQFTSWSSTSDGKYYYKTYTWSCATFKFILNNNSSSQTSDSDAYDTGKSYYIDTATKDEKGELIEGTPSAKAITYTSTASGADVTWGGTKPATAYPGDTVSFSVTAKSGYRLTGVKYNDGSDHTLTASSGTYSFTMPNKAVTVTATTVATYTVTLTTNTGIATKQYKKGSSGTYGTYSSAVTVDSGTDVYFKVTYTSGYEFGSQSGLTVVTTGTEFRTGAVTANKTVTINAQKKSFSGLSAVGKYSTTGASGSYTNTWTSGGPAVTIASTTATQLDGVAVSAPATDPTGYVFAGWYTANGSFTNSADKDTTFKPNAASAVAVATYKKVYTITSSVDASGTGAGTVSTGGVTTVAAGGSYTVTASPKSGSAVQSITVNNTNKGSNTSYTISSVSANQTVSVKFKSKVMLKGSMNPTSWAGEEMTSNSAGTSFTITKTLNANTTYSFKHYVDPDTWSTTVSTWTLNGIATHSTDGDGNLTITPTVKANVTFASDGSKFTSITAVPNDATKYNVTLTYSADYTITSTYMGTEYTTSGKSSNVVVQVYSGTSISYTVTAASGKYLSNVTVGGTPISGFTARDSYNGSISNVTTTKTIAATASNKVAITAKSNKSAYGTVSVSPTSARPGQTVTITVTEKAGQIQSLTWTPAGGSANTINVNSYTGPAKIASDVSSQLLGAASPKEKLLTGAGTSKLATGAKNYTFTMPNPAPSSVTVNATFKAYSAESNWYYNGYNTSGGSVSGYYDKQMTEAMIGGQKFSYYHVEGRSGGDQLFTVSNGHPGTNSGYVYFTRPGSNDWNESNVKAYFWKASDNSAPQSWPGYDMTWQWNNEYGQGVYKVAIPSGVDRVIFNDNNGHQTVNIDLTNTNGAYYWDGTTDGSGHYNVATWNTGQADQGWHDVGTEYFYSNTIYKDNFYTGGFNNHYVSSTNYTKPKGGNEVNWDSAAQGDYYIVVLYPNTTYTIEYNGHTTTNTVGSEPMVIWMTELPIEDDGVKVYAKDGSIRSESYGSTYANIADTKIYSDSSFTTAVGTDHAGSISGQSYETYSAGKGETIYIKTTINTTAGGGADTTTNRNKYYVRGFCINGEVSQLLEWNSSGVYTATYKIPEDYEGSKIEITPIYYLKDTTSNPIVTFRVTGFTDELKAVGSGKPGWGDTLYAYPFYGKLGSNNNAFGAYPGQPLVYYKGQYQIQIPQKSTAWDIYLSDSALSGTEAQKKSQVANTTVSGVTMSNGYYDIVHRQVMGYGDNSSSADHVQTYDYGDFYKIFNEKKPVDNIVFDFKYENKKHNFENQPASSITKSTLNTNYGTNGNGFELLTNFHGRHVDLFGTPLSGDAADPEKTTPVYVVSIGGVNGSAGVENIAGYYATEWMVYGSSNGTNYTRVTGGGKQSIPPEVLVLNDDDTTSFNNTTYPSAVSGKNLTDWKTLYQNLEAYRGKPVMITYEAADAQIGSGNYATSGGGGATRNDGRWLYSKNGETITSKIQIQYSDDNGATYTELDTTTPQVSGLSAYFTNDGVEGEQVYTTTIDPDKTFDFEAKTTNGNYKFVGWFMDDGTKITTDNIGHTERSGSYTFVAKFMQVSSGQLILSHSTATNDTYKGDGVSEIGVVVKDKDTDEVIRTYELSTSDITLDDRIIKSDSNYKVEVTLRSTPAGEGTLGLVNTESTAVAKFQPSTTTSQTITFDVTDLFSSTTQNIKSLIYHSYYNKVEYDYDITFKFNGRLYDNSGNRVENTFRKQGSLTAKEIESYVTGSTASHTRYISPDFLAKIVPYEENLGETINWNFGSLSESRRSFTYNSSANKYTITVNVANAYTATQTEDSKGLTITYDLPFEYDSYGRALNIDRMTKDGSQPNFVVNVNYGQVAKVDPEHGHGSAGDNQYDNTYVTAPKVLYDSSARKDTYFQYWAVKDKNDKVITKCYMTRFNFVAYDNYTIEPVYDDTEYIPESDESVSTSISFIDTTRNQWNDNGYGGAKDITNSDARTASDLLFNDFLLSYSYKGKELNSTAPAGVSTGFVVQRLDTLEKFTDGSVNTDTEYYEEKYAGTDNTAAIKTYITSNNNGGLNLNNISIATNQLDNKDRVQWYYSVYNSRGWSGDAPKNNYTYKRYVYRAYSYIYDSNEEVDAKKVTLSTPVYFTMYDKAVK